MASLSYSLDPGAVFRPADTCMLLVSCSNRCVHFYSSLVISRICFMYVWLLRGLIRRSLRSFQQLPGNFKNLFPVQPMARLFQTELSPC